MTSTRGLGPHWVYRCFDEDGRLLYVGCTTNLRNRLEQHRASSWWSPTVAKVTSKVFPDGESGRAAERAAIRDEIPRWNKASKWAGRSKWTRDDWHDWITTLLHDRFSKSLETSVRDYASLFGSPLPDHLQARYDASVADQERKAAAFKELCRQQDAERAARDTQELRELNEELRRTLDRQAALARALGIDWDDPDLLDASAAIDSALAERCK